MFVFLDESYNLKDRAKPQFISINGFMIPNVKPLWKRWKTMRLPYIGKSRIHGADRFFEPLRKKIFKYISKRSDITLLTVVQEVKTIPPKGNTAYYGKGGELIFGNVYFDLLKELLKELHPRAYKEIDITIDSRKHKHSTIGKDQFRKNILAFLENWYPNTQLSFELQPSSVNILLEVADFISNSFYKQYIGQETTVFKELEGKIVKMENPLKVRG
jgi:hypothetical protein